MIGAQALFDAAVTDIQTTGLFDAVNRHEVKSAPGHGLSADVWVQTVTPVLSSGLVSASVRVVLSIRLYASMAAEPQDDIDRKLLDATDQLMGNYTGNFQLTLNARNVDVFGQHGFPMNAQAGYLTMDAIEYRVMVITLPVILNDVWPESP